MHYRGMPKLAYTLGTRVFNERNSVVLKIGDRSRLKVYLRDGYWINLLFSGFEYEPEVAFILSHILREPSACFLDCGANIGYWSIISSEIISRPGRVWAIEASPTMFKRLFENCELNDSRFECLPFAVWSSDGEILEIVTHDQRHAGSSVVSRQEKRKQPGYLCENAQSITLDAIVDRHIPPELEIVLKLDVEGAEIAALQGAERMLSKRKPLVIYEDHGNDSACLVSQYMLDELGMCVFFCDWRLSIHGISTLAEVQRTKSDKRRGYNFLACSRESAFAEALAALTTM